MKDSLRGAGVAAIAFGVVTGFAMLADYGGATLVFGVLTILTGLDAAKDNN